jgi:hypothetical protein
MREEERGLLPTFEMSSSKSSGVGGPPRVAIFWCGAAFVSRPYSLLLMSSLSCRSFTISIVRRSCSRI